MAGLTVALRTRLAAHTAAIRPALAALAVVGVAALPLRMLLATLIPTLLSRAALAPAVIRHATTIAINFAEVIAVLAALGVYFCVTRRGSFAALGLARQGASWLPVGLLVPLAGVLLSASSAHFSGYLPAARAIYPGIWPVLLALAAATHAAWIEELIFRGILRQAIEARWNRTVAIIATAVPFVLLHLLAPFRLSAGWWGVVTVGGFGLAWSYYAARRSLWLPIGLHWGFNLWVFLLFGLPGVTRGALLWDESGGPAVLSSRGGWVLLLAALLTGGLLALILAARRVGARR
jgi:uncharacterized protein